MFLWEKCQKTQISFKPSPFNILITLNLLTALESIIRKLNAIKKTIVILTQGHEFILSIRVNAI